MQNSRLFEIVYILLGRQHVTAKELAARFEVSVRTIYRDIDTLSQAGVPVYATQGAGGGIHISDAYVLNKSALTDQEQGQILLALQSLSATGHTESNRLLSRLGSLFNKDGSDWIEVDFSRWGNAEHDRFMLSTLKDAILGRHPISFTYHSADGAHTQRTANPYKLIYKGRAWYLKAYCQARADFRTFKVVRMADITPLEEVFDRQAYPEPPVELAECWDSGPQIPVVVRFGLSTAWRVMDEFDPANVVRNEDGTQDVQLYFAEDDWLYGYILSYGTAAEVLSPPHVRANMQERLRKLLAQYENT